MIPKVIVTDTKASEKGADICKDCIRVRPENLEKLLEGFTYIFPNVKFEIKEENNG